jgi:hypothetical protein
MTVVPVGGIMLGMSSFRLAMIGFEVSGSVRAEAVWDGPPTERSYGLLPSAQADYLPAIC